MLVGTVLTTVVILHGDATVLYTFYARSRQARSSILAQRCSCSVPGASRSTASSTLFVFKRMNPAKRIPLPAFIATNDLHHVDYRDARCRGGDGAPDSVVARWTPGIDVSSRACSLVLRTSPGLFLDHGAYAIWYTLIPTTFGGKVFSDALTRVAFVSLLLLSTPVGLHHQYLDPESPPAEVAHTSDLRRRDPVVHDRVAIFASFEIAPARRAGHVAGSCNDPISLPCATRVRRPALGIALTSSRAASAAS